MAWVETAASARRRTEGVAIRRTWRREGSRSAHGPGFPARAVGTVPQGSRALPLGKTRGAQLRGVVALNMAASTGAL